MARIDWKTVMASMGATALVVVLLQALPAARGGGSTDNNGDLIAVTGEYGNGTSVLYVIDTKKRQMAVYRSLNGNGVQLVAARRIRRDLDLMSYHDNSPEGFSPMDLEKQFEEFRQKAKTETPPKPPEKGDDG